MKTKSTSFLGITETLEPVTETIIEAPKEKRYEVMADCLVPRASGSFLMRKGKVVSERGYDIDSLKAVGVKLQEVTG